MKQLKSIWVGAGACLSLMAISGGTEPQYTKAKITFMTGSNGAPFAVPKSIVVKEPVAITKLLRCLPDIEAKKLPLKPAGWNGRLYMVFTGPKVKSAMIFVSPAYDRWSRVGITGDALAKPELKGFLDELESKAK